VKHGRRLHFRFFPDRRRIVHRWCHLSSPLGLTRLLYNKVRKSSRSPHAPFPYVSKPGYSSSQLKQRPPRSSSPLLADLAHHLAHPVVTVAPVNATDEPKCASGRVRAGVGRRCSRCHGVTVSHSSPSSPEFPKGLNFTSRNPWSSGEATLRAPKGVVTVAVAAASLICKVHS
jgi:hypothetical protein